MMSFSDDHDRRLFKSLGPELVETIILIKRNDPKSTKLALDDSDLVDADDDEEVLLGRLGDIIGQNTTLKELVVEDCPEHNVPLLFPGLQNNRTIETLTFLEVPALALSGLSTFLSLNPKLRSITIGNCELQPSDIEILSTALLNRTDDTLESLSLDSNDELGDVPLDNLVRALARNSNLTELNLSCTGIGPVAFASLSALLESRESNLTRLDISYNNITGDVPLDNLVRALARNINLTELNLSCTGIGPVAFASLSALLESRESNLTRLDISYNNITEEFWSILLKILCDSSSIDAVIGSNHTLCDIVLGDGFGVEAITQAVGADDADLLCSLLDINRNEDKVSAMRHKVLWSHARRNSHLNIGDNPSIPARAMPSILAWLGDNLYSSAYGPSIKSTRLDSFYRILRTRPELLEDGRLNQRMCIEKTMDKMKGLCDENKALRDEIKNISERIGRLEAMMQAAGISESQCHI